MIIEKEGVLTTEDANGTKSRRPPNPWKNKILMLIMK
jgi:hypothetical protein